MHNPEPVLENKTHKLLWDFHITTDPLVSVRRPDLIIINKKWELLEIAVLADHRIKLKGCEKKDKYLDLAIELENMQVTIISIVIGAFGTVPKGLLKGLEDLEVGGRVETIKLVHYWERPEYWEDSWKLGETCCHSNSSERPSANADMKNPNE